MNRAIALLVLLLITAGLATCQQQRISRANAALKDAAQALQDSGSALRNASHALTLAKSETTIVTEYVDRVQIVRERGATITKEVPVYVTAQADAACSVPVGFVRIHDAAAQGTDLVGSAADPDAPAAGVALSTVADTVASNYTACHANAEQVVALQAYINELLATLRAMQEPVQ